MIGSVNCTYETPCGYCSKFDKSCDKKQPDRIQNEHFERSALTSEVLQGYGVSIIDNNMKYRAVNEVMIDICRKFRLWRSQGMSKKRV